MNTQLDSTRSKQRRGAKQNRLSHGPNQRSVKPRTDHAKGVGTQEDTA